MKDFTRFLRGAKNLSVREWIAFSADVLAFVLLAIEIYKPHLNREDADAIIAKVFCYIFTVNLFLLWLGEARLHAKARHADAQPSLHDAYHRCRDGWYKILTVSSAQMEWMKKKMANSAITEPCPSPDNSEIHDILKDAIVSFSSAFTLICGVRCRAYVKELVCIDPVAEPKERGFVTTTFFASEDMTEPENSQQFISDNHHIKELFSHPKARCFIRGDVTKIQNFHMVDREPGQHFEVRSVAVWPIRKYKEGSPDVIGYLCVDSQGCHAFDENLQFSVGASFADTLYPLLAGWRAVKKANNGLDA